MLQRLQTLFLLVIAILSGLLFLLPVAKFIVTDGGTFEFYADRVMEVTPEGSAFVARNIYSMILTIVSGVLPLIVIFMYKKLLMQIRFVIVEVVLQGGLLFLLWLQCNNLSNEAEILFQIALMFPVVNVILCLLSIRQIGKDVALLKSYDRIR